ncbi:hypothetical protein AMECASPLE_006079 [Ameca splendens]|uniref:Uncharacterized protein n=1 Tax=Ameca splendens TaxID=208324 RepID=A0ABV0ZJ34_9TELE
MLHSSSFSPALHVIPYSPAVSSPPSLPHQHFLFPLHCSCLLLGSSHRHSPLLAPNLACQDVSLHSLFSIFFIHVLFKRVVFPTPLFIQVDHLLSCILPSRLGSALNTTEAAYYLVLSFYHFP